MKAVIALVCLLIGYTNAHQTCTKQVDVVLVVEDSQFIPDVNAETNIREFLSNIVDVFLLGDSNGHVAFQQYGENNPLGSVTVFNLNQYSETNDAKSAIVRQPFTRFATTPPSIADALNYTWTFPLTVDDGERSCFPTVVILISYSSIDGPNSLRASHTPEQGRTLYWARELRHSGALLIAVGVGPHRDTRFLLELVNDPQYYHDFPDFSDLTTADGEATALAIANQACSWVPSPPFLPGEVEWVKADVVFVVDISTNLDATLTAAVVSFITNFAGPFTYGSDGLQLALVTYSTVGYVAATLNGTDTNTLAKFLTVTNTALGATKFPDRNINDALDRVANHVFIESAGFRTAPGVRHQVYIFTADCFTGSDPVNFANQIRTAKNAEIFVVQMSTKFQFWKEIIDVAQDRSNIWEAQANPTVILSSYLPEQAWRTIVPPGYVVPPPVTTTTGTTTTTTTTVATPPHGKK